MQISLGQQLTEEKAINNTHDTCYIIHVKSTGQISFDEKTWIHASVSNKYGMQRGRSHRGESTGQQLGKLVGCQVGRNQVNV